MKTLLPALAAVALLGGCASGGHCVGELDYQKAYSLPAVSVADVKMPSSSAALVIPPPPAQIVPYGFTKDDPKKPGRKVTECLDTPPRLPTLTPQPVTEPAKS